MWERNEVLFWTRKHNLLDKSSYPKQFPHYTGRGAVYLLICEECSKVDSAMSVLDSLAQLKRFNVLFVTVLNFREPLPVMLDNDILSIFFYFNFLIKCQDECTFSKSGFNRYTQKTKCYFQCWKVIVNFMQKVSVSSLSWPWPISCDPCRRMNPSWQIDLRGTLLKTLRTECLQSTFSFSGRLRIFPERVGSLWTQGCPLSWGPILSSLSLCDQNWPFSAAGTGRLGLRAVTKRTLNLLSWARESRTDMAESTLLHSSHIKR